MSEAAVELFPKSVVTLSQTLELHGERLSSQLDACVELKPPTEPPGWSTKENLRFRFLVDAASVCLQVCTAEQADHCSSGDNRSSFEKEMPHFGAKVPTDASPGKFILKCGHCGKIHYSIHLQPQKLELPSCISVKVDLSAILRTGCCVQYYVLPKYEALDESSLGNESQGTSIGNAATDERDNVEQEYDRCEQSFTFEVALIPWEDSSLTPPTPYNVLNKLHEGRLYSDLSLRVGEADLPAHRSVLAACSPVFRSMLAHEGFTESQRGVVDVKDIRVEVMEAALRYMYNKEVGMILDSKTHMDLLVMAERYQMQDLKTLCERTLAADTSADPLELLALADVHNAQILLEAVIEKIVGHPDKNKILGETCSEDFICNHPTVVKKLFKRM